MKQRVSKKAEVECESFRITLNVLLKQKHNIAGVRFYPSFDIRLIAR